VEGWEGFHLQHCHGGIDCIVIAVGYRFPAFRLVALLMHAAGLVDYF
jgi:hypothetical protein